mmetsp:Transcript_73054/g.190597  ORF Transcript_73054/g.190597 Transcript_73054/m.190597 type:complete len:209 (+) Transcript_73054:760-1386(+)
MKPLSTVLEDVTLPETTEITCSPSFPVRASTWCSFRRSRPFAMILSLKISSMSACEGIFSVSKWSTSGSPPGCGMKACAPPPSERAKTTPGSRSPSNFAQRCSAKPSAEACRVPAAAPFCFRSWNFSDGYFRCMAAPLTELLWQIVMAPSFGCPRRSLYFSASGILLQRASSSCFSHLSVSLWAVRSSSMMSKLGSPIFLQISRKHLV